MLMKKATIAVAVLATSLLALVSVRAAAETQRSGGMAAGNKAGGGPSLQRVRPRSPNTKGKKYKGQTPPTQSQPYCPYGRKADGTCWVRCRYTICL